MSGSLFEAAHAGDTSQVLRLLSEGADVDSPGSQGHTPLAIAALHGHSEVVSILLQHGADPNAPAETGHNPLRLAGGFHHHAVVERLIAAGARVGIIEAATIGDCTALRRLIADGIPVDGRDATQTTGLIEAAGHGHEDAVQLLLDAGADIDAQTTFGWTALMKALHSGHAQAARLLIERGANVQVYGRDGSNALLCAVMSFSLGKSTPSDKQVDIVLRLEREKQIRHDLIRMLVQAGSNVNLKGPNGITPLWWAEQMRQRDTCQLLRDLGAVE